MSRSGPPGGTSRLRTTAAVSVSLITALGVAACGGPAPAPSVSQVERGTVAVKVAASGALSSIDSQNLGFRAGARLTALNVRIGDTVTPGEVLAKIDDYRFKNARDLARAAADGARANLDAVRRGVTVPNARDILEEAQKSYDKAVNLANAQVDAAEDAERRANVKYGYDRRQLAIANYRLRAIGCDDSQSSESNLDDASRSPDYIPPPPPSPGTMPSTSALAPSSPGLTGALSGVGSSDAEAPNCTTYRTAAIAALQTAFTSKAAYVTAQNATIVARKTRDTGIQTAHTALVTNQTLLRTARVGRPFSIQALTASLNGLLATLSNAEQDLRDTVLISPVGGTVSAINGTIGEYVGSGSGTSAQSPGSDAPIPGVGAAASSDQAGNAASGISATKPGGSAFIVLNNVNSYQVVVPFEESDATRIQPNQPVDVSFDSIPDLDIRGTVLSIAPGGVNISGVTNYYATVLLSRSDPRLKTGLTAEAGVMVRSVDNVLKVPNSAVTKRNGRSYVTVVGPDGSPREQEFQPGMVGNDSTQVLSGLREGQQLQPPARPVGS